MAGPARGDSGGSKPVVLAPGPADSIASVPRTALGDEPIRTRSGEAARQGETVPDMRAPAMDYPRVLGALGIVIGLIFLLRWGGRLLFPTATGRSSSRAVEVLSRSVLAPKQQVMLLRVGRRLIVVGDSGSQMNSLCEIADPDEVAALVGQLRDEKIAGAARFGSLFGRFRKPFEAADEELVAPAPPLQDEEDPAPLTSAREELSGLRERVRLLSDQFKE